MREFERKIKNIHLDFHNPSWVTNLGEKLDPKNLIKILTESHADTITFPAKDHHGNCYYDTKIGHGHPYLRTDIFGEILKEAHRNGLKFIAYYSVIWDEQAASHHPDWVEVTKDGERLIAKGTQPSRRWSFLCLNSPYVEELVHPQIIELIKSYDIDGFWFDILQYGPHTCYCNYCRKKREARYISTPNDPKNIKHFLNKTVQNFAADTTKLIKSLNPDIWVTYNSIQGIGKPYQFREYVDYYTIEAVPEESGYMYFPVLSRHMRNLKVPLEGMTVVFHGTWGDFGTLKHLNQLKYELATFIANGCAVSVGDQLPPNGEFENNRLKILKSGFNFLKDRGDWAIGSKSLRDIAILGESNLDFTSSSVRLGDKALLGAAKFLLETHDQFDVLSQELLRDIPLADFALLILPDLHEMSSSALEKIREYVAAGGKILATYRTSLKEGNFGLSDVFGASFSSFSPYSLGYFRFQSPPEETLNMDIISRYSFAQLIQRDSSVRVLARLVNPMIERSNERFFGHYQAPPGQLTHFPAVVFHQYGKGSSIYIATALFKDFYKSDSFIYRKVLQTCLNYLYPQRALDIHAPLSVEVSALSQPKERRVIIHFVNYHTIKRGGALERIEEFPEWRSIKVRIREDKLPGEVNRVYVAPGEKELEWRIDNGYLETILPSLKIHQMLIIE